MVCLKWYIPVTKEISRTFLSIHRTAMYQDFVLSRISTPNVAFQENFFRRIDLNTLAARSARDGLT